MASDEQGVSTAELLEKAWRARKAAGHFDEGDNDHLEESIDTGDRRFRDYQPGRWRHRLWYRRGRNPSLLRDRSCTDN